MITMICNIIVIIIFPKQYWIKFESILDYFFPLKMNNFQLKSVVIYYYSLSPHSCHTKRATPENKKQSFFGRIFLGKIKVMTHDQS